MDSITDSTTQAIEDGIGLGRHGGEIDAPYQWPCMHRQMMTSHPWFFVQYALHFLGTKFAVGRSSLLTHPDQISWLHRHPRVRVTATYIASLPWKNGSPDWRLEPLEEIWVGDVPYEAGPGRREYYEEYVFVVADGARYVGFYPYQEKIQENDMENMRRVFKARRFPYSDCGAME